jgi:hypothetical protein
VYAVRWPNETVLLEVFPQGVARVAYGTDVATLHYDHDWHGAPVLHGCQWALSFEAPAVLEATRYGTKRVVDASTRVN